MLLSESFDLNLLHRKLAEEKTLSDSTLVGVKERRLWWANSKYFPLLVPLLVSNKSSPLFTSVKRVPC